MEKHSKEKTIAEIFAKREENEKYRSVARVVELLLLSGNIPEILSVADLGGGAHSDSYDELFARLLASNPKGSLDWVDSSPDMLLLARGEYLQKNPERAEVIQFQEVDLRKYLEVQREQSLDIVLMKYTFDLFQKEDVQKIFLRVRKVLKQGGKFIATLSMLDPTLKGVTTNAQMVYKGQEIPRGETAILQTGDEFTIKFFKDPEKSELGFIEGADVTKIYLSKETIRSLAKEAGFSDDEIFVGNWRDFPLINNEAKNDPTLLDQGVLVLQRH